MKKRSWIQPIEAARYFGVAPHIVRGWIFDGTLRAAKLPTGHFRILVRDVVKFLLRMGKSIPDELGNLAHKHVLILDQDHDAASAMAEALQRTSGCKVTIAENGAHARDFLNGSHPDLVLLGVGLPGNGKPDSARTHLVFLARATDDPLPAGPTQDEAAFRISDLLPMPMDERLLASRVAHVLLG